MRGPLSRELRAFLLVLPLITFLGVFFAWPIWTMVSSSFRNDGLSEALPLTAAEIRTWDGAGLPSAAVQHALVEDLRGADRIILGGAVRMLNAQVSGFRSLIPATTKAVQAQEGAVVLSEIDPRWTEPRFWLALRASASPYTDRHLLAAIDLERDASGALKDAGTSNAQIFLRTFTIAGTVTLLCVLIGLPYAMVINAATGWRKTALLVAVLIPMWTSLLVRSAAWFILLQDEGLINGALQALGLTDGPLALIFNRAGVVLAMTHVLLPFMVLPTYTVLTAIPKNLMPAAASMGATPLRAFVRVLLPLAMPGVLAGALLTFMVALGYYITPALVGGPGDQMISSIIAFYALQTANWPMAGALGLMLLVITTGLYLIYGRLTRANAIGA